MLYSMVAALLFVHVLVAGSDSLECSDHLKLVLNDGELSKLRVCTYVAEAVCNKLSEGDEELCGDDKLLTIGRMGADEFFRDYMEGRNVIVRIKFAVSPYIYHHEFALQYRAKVGGAIYQANTKFTGGAYHAGSPDYSFSLDEWINGKGNVAIRDELKVARVKFGPNNTSMDTDEVKAFLRSVWRMKAKFEKGGETWHLLKARRKDRVEQGCEESALAFGIPCNEFQKKHLPTAPAQFSEEPDGWSLVFSFAVAPLLCR